MLIDKTNPDVFKKQYLLTKEYSRGADYMSFANMTRIMQDITEAHMTAIGMDHDMLREKGWLWVIIWNSVRIDRLPDPGEKVTIYTWCGKEKFNMFSRRYAVEGTDGSVLFTASGLFAMMDKNTRKLVNSETIGHVFPVTQMEGEPPMSKTLMKFPAAEKKAYHEVMDSEIDKNGHVNNACYLDWADEILLQEKKSYPKLSYAWVEYDAELRQGQTAELEYTFTDQALYVQGFHEGVLSYKVYLEYRQTT